MENNVKIKTVRLRPEVIEKIQRLADKDNRSFSNKVDTILDKYEEEV